MKNSLAGEAKMKTPSRRLVYLYQRQQSREDFPRVNIEDLPQEVIG